MKKILFILTVGLFFSLVASAHNFSVNPKFTQISTEKSYLFPSGDFTFIDGCGNNVSATWSCNFSCSQQDIVSAIVQFISGYGCGNYDQVAYPY
jgi:hypothetical protein